MPDLDNSTTEGFFLEAESGIRFCLYHAPFNAKVCRGGIVYIPPFAEELNKSRRMAALQARSLSANGYAVLLIDFYGCGDSSGELKDADWAIWKDDILLAIAHLRNKVNAPVSLLGLRLGALMALDIARSETRQTTSPTFKKIVLWQPVIQGSSYLNQFFRLQLANDLLKAPPNQAESKSVRQQLNDGATVEIAGYEITPRLAHSIDQLDASSWHEFQAELHWFECLSDHNIPIPAARVKLHEQWKNQGIDLHIHTIIAPQFWMSQELTICQDLLDATTTVFKGTPA